MLECPKEDDFSGIYKITNTINNRVYIGQSIHVNDRLKKHKQILNRNSHENMYLQNSWNKHGEYNYTFEAIEECPQERLLERENFWMNQYGSYLRKNGFNIMKPSDNLEKFPHTEEHNKRISEGRRLYSDEELFSHLHEVYYMTGKIPDYNLINIGMSDNFHQIYGRRFGGLKKAVVLSGILTKKEAERYTQKTVPLGDLLYAFRIFIEEHRKFPNLQEMVLANGLYGQSVIFKYFKGIVEFREYLDFTAEDQRKLEQKDELNIIKEIHDEHGYITTTLIDKAKRTRNSKTLVIEYGSAEELYIQSGIDFEENRKKIAFNRRKNLKQYQINTI